MMNAPQSKKTFFCCLAWFVSVSCASAVSASEQPTKLNAVPLLDVKNVTSLDSEWKTLVCNLLSQPCDTQSVKLYKPKNWDASQYYAIASSGPVMAKLVLNKLNRWQIVQHWDFSQNTHTSPPIINDLGGMPSPLVIYPALYPVASNQWAAAIISTYRESYSGGVAGFDTADFIVLNDSTDKQAKISRVFSSIPFSCGKHIRACFSENEYRTSPHCQEENFGKLLLQFKSTKPHAAYDWLFTWQETSWPAHQPAKQQKVVKTQFLIHPDTDVDKQIPEIEKISFCGGPQ